jgi:hypothetical protein
VRLHGGRLDQAQDLCHTVKSHSVASSGTNSGYIDSNGSVVCYDDYGFLILVQRHIAASLARASRISALSFQTSILTILPRFTT